MRKPARDLLAGDRLREGVILKVDKTTTWGVVYVTVSDQRGSLVYNHGEAVEVLS